MRGIELRQLARRNDRDARKPLAFAGLEQLLRVGAAEALDHASRVERLTFNVKEERLWKNGCASQAARQPGLHG